ncbi:MAG: hypothetical protein IJ077_08315 [Eubacterium sp.]|nr:hypothetical protein [Eubacterium sp.]MBR1530977.1 hypothetical protein [Eubacterium sp.]
MKTLELDESNLRKGWGGVGEYWFSLRSFSVKSDAELSSLDCPENMSHSEFFVSLGYIPYFTVNSEEVIRAFIPHIERKKLREAIEKFTGNDYVENFWKYFHIYPEISDPYINFEHDYVKNKAVKWCKENDIKYEFKV